jgi:hypothetical protein
MAKFKCNLARKGAKMAGAVAAKGAKATGDLFTITDLGGGTLSVTGHDAAGAGGIDISNVATLTVTTTDGTVSVDPPVGMTCTVHGVKPGTATLTVTATWNDGSIGPFSIAVTATITTSAVTGLDVVFTDAQPQ